MNNQKTFPVNTKILYVKDLCRKAKLIYVYLSKFNADFCKGTKTSFRMTDKELAQHLGMSLKALKKYKKELKNKAPHLIHIKSEGIKGTRYTFLDKEKTAHGEATP